MRRGTETARATTALYVLGIQAEMEREEVMSSRRNQDGDPKQLKGGWENNSSDGELEGWLRALSQRTSTPDGAEQWKASLKMQGQVRAELNRRRAARRKK